MSEKTIKDRIVNLLLSLYIINQVNKTSTLENNLKHQKLVFLSQKLLNERQRKGFRYFFLRWNQGPFSANVNEDLVLLKNSGFINWGENKITLTDEGKNLLEMSKEIFDSNKTFLKYVDNVLAENSPLSPEEIKIKVYGIRMFLPNVRRIIRIEEVPPKQLLLCGLSEKKARYSFEIGDDWLDTLEVIFDEEAMDLLKKAEIDARKGNFQVLNAI